jgi:hypothetical protein
MGEIRASSSSVIISPVRPENPNQLKCLTFTLDVIIVERCIVPYPLTSREQVSDHATHRLCSRNLYYDLVLVASLHANANHRFAAPSRGL